MTDNTTINGQLKFTSGYLYIDNYSLTLGSSSAMAGIIQPDTGNYSQRYCDRCRCDKDIPFR